MTFKIKLSTFVIFVIFLFSSALGFIFFPEMKERFFSGQVALVQTVNAEEIYPLFLCPCCGKPLDKNNICCGMAEEMIAYIDSLSQKGLSEKEVIIAYVKKYGLDSFVEPAKKNELRADLIAAASEIRPIISLSAELFDWGDVSQKKGTVSRLFEIKNEGKADLVINKLDSSCGCTSASIIYQGKEGPRFAMEGHGIENPTSWSLTVPAGETAQLKVYYDPNAHKDLRGSVTRVVSIFSNDPIDFEKKLTIELNQVD